MHIITSSKRGQIVIPKEVRRKLHIKEKTRLLIKACGDHAVITPMPDDPVESFCGIFKDKSSLTGALLEERKKERKHETKKGV